MANFFFNINQCLSMDKYEFFFYERCSKKELVIFPDISLSEKVGISTLRKCVSDIRIRAYADLARTAELQIVFAIRNNISEAKVFRDTFLYQLLHLAESLIVLDGYKLCVNTIVYSQQAYLRSVQFEKDCELLIKDFMQVKESNADKPKEWNADEPIERSKIEEISKNYVSRIKIDALKDNYFDLIGMMFYEIKESSSDIEIGLNWVVTYIRYQLGNLGILDLNYDVHNPYNEMIANLRIVDYLSTDYQNPDAQRSELYLMHWRDVLEIDSDELGRRYSKKLTFYKEKLQLYIEHYESVDTEYNSFSEYPPIAEPTDTEIGETRTFGKHDGDGLEYVKTNPIKRIDLFAQHLLPVNDMMARWNQVYLDILEVAKQANDELRTYDSLLSAEYTQKISARKRTEEKYRATEFKASDAVEASIPDREKKRNEILSELSSADMTPVVKFQEQLNLFTIIERANIEISHYIKCLEAISTPLFFKLLATLTGAVFALCVVLQPNNLFSLSRSLYFAIYLFIVIVVMSLAWVIPFRLYRKIIVNKLKAYSKEIDEGIKSYFDKAEKIARYVNLMNQLDYYERSIALRKRAVEYKSWRENIHRWYVDNARIHIEKTRYFEGLLERNYVEHPVVNDLPNSGPISGTDRYVKDYKSCDLFWP